MARPPTSMRAMVFAGPGKPLECRTVPVPRPSDTQALVRIGACAVCRTDLHVVDGELPDPRLPLVPGHEIVGRVAAVGRAVTGLAVGQRVGIPWLGWTCGRCKYCTSGRENLCPQAKFTGYTLDGGYAEYTVAEADYCLPLGTDGTDAESAPLLCAGLIGYRCLKKAGAARRIGIYGFGAAAHLVIQVARSEGREVLAFTRPGDTEAQDFARGLGASWAGDSTAAPPAPLEAALLFAPAGALVPAALRAVEPGGCVVCGGIHMSDIPSFPYEILWQERTVTSVANLTRKDGREFLQVAAATKLKTTVRTFPLEEANEALGALRSGKIQGAAVLVTT